MTVMIKVVIKYRKEAESMPCGLWECRSGRKRSNNAYELRRRVPPLVLGRWHGADCERAGRFQSEQRGHRLQRSVFTGQAELPARRFGERGRGAPPRAEPQGSHARQTAWRDPAPSDAVGRTHQGTLLPAADPGRRRVDRSRVDQGRKLPGRGECGARLHAGPAVDDDARRRRAAAALRLPARRNPAAGHQAGLPSRRVHPPGADALGSGDFRQFRAGPCPPPWDLDRMVAHRLPRPSPRLLERASGNRARGL